MDLMDWLFLWSLPRDPVDLPDAIELAAGKFRELAESDMAWLNYCLRREPNEVIGLSPWIGSIGGTFPPAGQTWHEWVMDWQTADKIG